MSVIFTNARLLVSTSTSLGTRDLSNRTMELTLSRDADEHDDTVMGLTDHSRVIGLSKWEFKTKMLQSFTTGDGGENTDAILDTLYTLSKAGSKFLVYTRPDTTAAQGPANPGFQGLCVLKGFDPLAGKIGDVLQTAVTFLGSGALSRLATSS